MKNDMSSKINQNKKTGFIKMYRSIRKNWLFGKKPYTQLHAFIDLLMEAQYENRDIEVGNTIITVGRGQIYRSIRDWSNRWGWHRSRVHRYLQKLEFDSVILRKNVKKQDMITIVNYDDYQDKRDVPETILRQSRDNPETPHSLLGKEYKEDINNINQDIQYINNNIYITQLQSLLSEYGVDDGRMNEIFSSIKDDEEVGVIYLEKIKSVIQIMNAKKISPEKQLKYLVTSIDNFNPKIDAKSRKFARKIIKENERRKKRVDQIQNDDAELNELKQKSPDLYWEFVNSGMTIKEWKEQHA